MVWQDRKICLKEHSAAADFALACLPGLPAFSLYGKSRLRVAPAPDKKFTRPACIVSPNNLYLHSP